MPDHRLPWRTTNAQVSGLPSVDRPGDRERATHARYVRGTHPLARQQIYCHRLSQQGMSRLNCATVAPSASSRRLVSSRNPLRTATAPSPLTASSKPSLTGPPATASADSTILTAPLQLAVEARAGPLHAQQASRRRRAAMGLRHIERVSRRAYYDTFGPETSAIMQRCVNSPTGSSASCTAVLRMRLPTTKPPPGPTTTAPELDTENLGCLFRWLIRQVAGDTDVVIMLRSDSSAPAGYRFPQEVIAVAARWYLRYGLSYRDRRATQRSRASPLPPDRSTQQRRYGSTTICSSRRWSRCGSAS